MIRAATAKLPPLELLPDNDGCWSTVEVCKMTGATYRQLDYWCRTGRIPGQKAGASTGSGHRRRWTEADVAEVRLWLEASELLAGGLHGMVARLRQEKAS